MELCRLMKVLRNEDVGKVRVKKRMSQIEASGNLALALQAMKQDGVKLVNIGKRTDTLLTSRVQELYQFSELFT